MEAVLAYFGERPRSLRSLLPKGNNDGYLGALCRRGLNHEFAADLVNSFSHAPKAIVAASFSGR